MPRDDRFVFPEHPRATAKRLNTLLDRVTDLETGGAAEWAPNVTADADLYIPAREAMTVDQGNAAIGTATIAFEKSTAAAPGTFAATSLPVSLEAGAWLKVAFTSVSGFAATHLVRTA